MGALTDGNKKMMLIVNIADKDITSDVKWKADEYNFSEENYKLSGKGRINLLSDGTSNITVEKESYICIEWN